MIAARRLSPLTPDRLDEPQHALYDAVALGPRAAHATLVPVVEPDGTLAGPFDALVRSPAVGSVVQQLGAALRYGSSLSPRERELVTLYIAGRAGSAYEIGAHRLLGAQAGLTTDEVRVCAAGGLPPVTDAREGVLLPLAAALADGEVPATVADDALARIGEPGLASWRSPSSLATTGCWPACSTSRGSRRPPFRTDRIPRSPPHSRPDSPVCRFAVLPGGKPADS